MIIQSIALLDQVNYSIVPVVMYMRNAVINSLVMPPISRRALKLYPQLDKDINTFAMRVREWYSWHFPELKDLVKDNYIFARVASFVGDKSSLSDVEESKAEGLAAILGGDEILARAVIHASRTSMGMDTSVPDMQNIVQFTGRMVKLAEYRMQVEC
jgi:nucleolar protein 56